MIFHITYREQWEQAKVSGSYQSDTLDTEGFIHCSTFVQVVNTANRYFQSQTGLLLLCIDVDKVQAEIKYGGVEDYNLFPHIYGRLNLDAVVKIIAFEPGMDGLFKLPQELVFTGI